MPELTWDIFRESISDYVGLDIEEINKGTDEFLKSLYPLPICKSVTHFILSLI